MVLRTRGDQDLVTPGASKTIQGWIQRAVALVTGAAVLALMVHTAANALLRKFANHPLEGTLEYVGNWYFPTIVLLGLVLAQQRREHMEAPILYTKAPLSIRLEWDLIGYALTFAMSVVFAWHGWIEAMENMELRATAGVSGVTMWPATFAVPIGFALLALQVVFDAIAIFRGDEPPIPTDAPLMSGQEV